MQISQDIVKQVAHLARIDLTPKELESLSWQLQDILKFIDKLQKIETKDITPTSHILPIENVLREDSVGQSLSAKEALKNAGQREGDFFVVPKIIEQE